MRFFKIDTFFFPKDLKHKELYLQNICGTKCTQSKKEKINLTELNELVKPCGSLIFNVIT